MSSVHEIEAAVRALSKADQAKLLDRLRFLFDDDAAGDKKWNRILKDARPRPALTALGDAVAKRFRNDFSSVPEIRDADFD